MTREFAEAYELDPREALTFEQLVELSGLRAGDLRELVEYGALAPLDVGATTWSFSTEVVVVARTACRLQHDFELDAHALSVVLRFVERVEALEGEVRRLRARMSR